MSDLDDISSDAAHLYHLLDILVGMMMERPHGSGDQRDLELDRMDSIAWVARDLAQKVVDDIEAMPRQKVADAAV